MHFLWQGPGAAQTTKTFIVIHFNCSQVGSRQLLKMKRTRESSVGERKWPRWEQWNPNKGDHIYCGEEPPAPLARDAGRNGWNRFRRTSTSGSSTRSPKRTTARRTRTGS
jgi:hypothetical protein